MVKGDEIPERWLQVLANVVTGKTQTSHLAHDVSQSDVLVLEIGHDNRSTFYHNGNRLGVIDDAGFGQQFVDIWLAPTTTRPELRLALIGAAD